MKNPLIEPLEARIAPATFSIATPTAILEGDSGTKDLVFTVTLTDAITSDATVHFTTANGGAPATQATAADSDYTLTAGTLTFIPGGPAEQFIRVPIIGDTKREVDELFTVSLDTPTGGATIDPTKTSATGTILNDDPIPTLSISDVTIAEGDSGTKVANFTVTLSNRSSSIITVRASTADGTATAGTDYDAVVNQTFTFLPSSTSPLTRTLSVNITGDSVPELDETFRVILSAPTNATLGDAEGIGTITNDDVPPTISIDTNSLAVATVEGDSGTKLMNFTVNLSKAFTEDVTVTASTSPGTATSGVDFTATSQLLTFTAGQTTKTFSVPIVGDLTDEADETFSVDLTNPSSNAVLGAGTHAVGMILNDEVQISTSDVSILETNGDTTMTFNVTLSKASNFPISVSFETQDGTAVSTPQPGDFDAKTGTLNFAPGQTTLPVSILIHGDSIGEVDETFLLKLTSPSGAVLGRATATGTILNDEATLRISDAQVLEGGVNGVTQAVFTVTLANGPTSGNVTVNFGTVDGTATVADSDYTALLATANTLTFAPGETTKQIMVPIKGDVNDEANETFSVVLSGPSSNVTIAQDTGIGTILNDDGAVFTVSDVTVTEGDAGTSNATFLVRLLNPSTSAVTVDVETVAGTASAADFTPLALKTLTFAAGTTQQLVTVPIVGDLIREGTETFLLKLSNPSEGVTLAKSEGVGTILDNGDPVPTLSIGNGTLVEGNSGTSSMTFVVSLSEASDTTVSATYSTRDLIGAAHPAVAGVDYTSVQNGTVTFAPGQKSVEISVPIAGDTTDEFDETFGVTLSGPSGAALGTADGVGTIRNDEVTVSIGDVTLVEGNNGTTTYVFQVSLNTPGGGALQNGVTVNFATADGTAISTGVDKDFTAKTGTLTFAPGGALSQEVAITVATDTRHEANEEFFVNLSSSTNAEIVGAQGKGTITNDDLVKVSIGDATITEGNTGTSSMTFTVTLDKASDVAIAMKANTVAGTATAGSDFAAIANQTITFAPGETSKTVTVPIVGDTLDEARNETFQVVLSAVTPGGVSFQKDTGTGTITDNDLKTLSVSNISLVEGDSGTVEADFTVTLSGVSTQAVSFEYATADASATAGSDYVAKQGTGTIAAGQTTTHVKVLVNGDTASEINERFLLNLVSSPNANISTTAGQATATIVDDEVGGGRLQLVPVNGVDFDETDQIVEFRVVRTGDISKAASVQYETLDDLAQSFGDRPDFVAKSGTVSFAAGSTTASETIRVRILADTNFENDETFQIRLFNPVNAALVNDLGGVVAETETDVTINDDPSDVAPTLSIADVRIVEGNAGTQQMEFTVKLSASNEKQAVTVDWETAAGINAATSANSLAQSSTQLLVQDYVAPDISAGKPKLTFATGETEQKIRITINGDVRDEADEETFRVLLSGATNATITRGEATGTIVDDDAAPTLTFSGPSTPIQEGDAGQTTATFTATLSEVSERPISVDVTTQAGTAVSTGANPDFQPLDHFKASYVPGTASKTFTFDVLVNGDTVNEGSETFSVKLSDAVNAKIIGSTASATATIADNDPQPVIVVNNASVIEGNSGTKEMVFTVSLTAASEQAVEVKFATAADGTANAATSSGPMADFVAKTGTLKFAPGETQKEVRVVINGDTFKEQNETFSLQISAPVNGTILSPTATGTILTDGDTKVGIAIRDAFAVEGASGTSTMSFTVELSDSLTTATTFGAVATSGTAVRGSDFAPLSTTKTIAANTKAATVEVTLNGDNTFEATESFFVGLRNVVNAGGADIEIVGGAGRGTIFNDDLRRVNNQTLQYIDVDGDLVTVRVSKGVLSTNRLTFGTPNAIGGRQLQIINLTGENTQFQNANLAVTAAAQPGFNGDANGVKGDGFVNVGAIYAAIAQPNILQFVNGIDLGTVTIDGDLGKIHAGDTTATAAIQSLVVRSMGKFGTATQGGTSGLDTVSLVLGPINSMHVLTNFQSTLQVVGSQFGLIRNLQIDGALLGGSDANSGEIFVTGGIANAQIGRIVGGAGDNSGSLIGSSSVDSKIVKVRVLGAMTGGTGKNSGVISAVSIGAVRVGSLTGGAGDTSGDIIGNSIDSVVVARSITGGDGKSSGEIFANGVLGAVRVLGEVRGGKGEDSGLIGATVRAGSVYVFGSIFGGAGLSSGRIQVDGAITQLQTGALVGGAGVDSGTIQTGTNIQSLTINGDVLGGSGNGSGGIDVGGRLLSGLITGDLLGGDSTATASLSKSGYVVAHRIGNLTVRGDLESGANGGAGIVSSGAIRSETTIGILRIGGNVTGSENVAAIISATGDTSGATIQSLQIGGDLRFAEILAGYGVNATLANARGDAANADAQIGTVSVGRNLQNSSIVAGVAAGTDGLFGTTDDFPIGGAGTTNAAGTVSKIARIIIGGNVLAGTSASGIEAQYVQSVTVRRTPFSLQAGPGNDGAPGAELVAGSKVRVFEVPV